MASEGRRLSSSRTRRSAWRLAALSGALALAVIGCGGEGARAPNPTRPLDERRAIEVIRAAIRAERAEPGPSREAALDGGKSIMIDVGVVDHEYGIAYITQEDARALGSAIPPPNKKDERLRILRVGTTGETRIVILYQDNYLYDDLAGSDHEQTALMCEGQLKRDVQDFITHARSLKYK